MLPKLANTHDTERKGRVKNSIDSMKNIESSLLYTLISNSISDVIEPMMVNDKQNDIILNAIFPNDVLHLLIAFGLYPHG